MYSRNNSTWLKHWDFILLDLVMFQLAYICSYVIRMGIQNPYGDPTYLNIGAIICLIDLCAVFFTEPYHGIMRRGYFLEFKSTLNHVFLVCAVEAGYLFLSKRAPVFSRLSFIWFIVTSIVLIYAERIIWKQYLVRHKRLFYEKVKMFLVTTRDEADNVLERMKLNSFNEFEIIGIAYAGETPEENERVRGIPVVCRADEIPDYIQTRWIDAVFISVEDKTKIPAKLVKQCLDMERDYWQKKLDTRYQAMQGICKKFSGPEAEKRSTACLEALEESQHSWLAYKASMRPVAENYPNSQSAMENLAWFEIDQLRKRIHDLETLDPSLADKPARPSNTMDDIEKGLSDFGNSMESLFNSGMKKMGLE